jgi:hypothetical protein
MSAAYNIHDLREDAASACPHAGLVLCEWGGGRSRSQLHVRAGGGDGGATRVKA